jgi:cytochrome c biogenesis protein CcmG/thiol:disulfide interchange protein DsbE
MTDQEPMTRGDVAGRPDRGPGLLGAYRRLSRPRRLVITSATAVLAVVVALLIAGAVSGGKPKAAAAPRAPGFTLSVLGHPGKHLSLASFAGRPVIVNFFASWCAPCQKETPLIARYFRAQHERVTIVGVDANDTTSNALKFTRKAGVSYPVVSDPAPMRTTLSYGVSALPQTFFLNAQHRIVKRVFGPLTTSDLRAGVTLMASTPGGR